MDLSGKWNGDVTGFAIKANKSHDGREAFVDVEISVKQDEAEKKLGADFAALAFSTLRVIEADPDDEESHDGFAFLVDSVKPGRRVVCQLHRVVIGDEEVTVQPELRGIRTIDGEARVVAQIRIPVDVSKKALLNSLTGQVGQTLKIEFEPAQGKLFSEEQASRPRVVRNEAAAEA